MSHATRFDTLAYANKLKNAGVPAEQAEAQFEALAEILDCQIATKKDLQETEKKFEKNLHGVETRFDSQLAEMKIDIIKWMISLLFLQSGLMIGAVKVFIV